MEKLELGIPGFCSAEHCASASLVPQIRDFNGEGGKQPWCWQIYFQAQFSFADAWEGFVKDMVSVSG